MTGVLLVLGVLLILAIWNAIGTSLAWHRGAPRMPRDGES